jgi:hypothetical protein
MTDANLQQYFIEEWGNHWLSGITSLCNDKPLNIACPTFIKNKNMTLKMILAIPKQIYDRKYQSANPNLTMDFIKKHEDFGWKWKEISKNAGISMQDIMDNPEMPWCSNQFSYNPNLTIEFVLAHWDYKWNWEYIFEHVNIPIETVMKLENMHKHTQYRRMYCINKYVTESVVRTNWHYPWNYNALSENANISLNFAMEHKSESWNWADFLRRADIHDIEKHEDFLHNKTDFKNNPYAMELSKNPTITVEFIMKRRDYRWCFRGLLRYSTIPFDELITILNTNRSKADFEWMQYVHVGNPNVTAQFLHDYINNCGRYNIHGSGLFRNSHVPFYIALSHQLTFKNHVNEIVAHPYNKDRQQFIETKMKNILLLSIYDFHQQPHIYIECTHIEKNEQIVANSYIMMWIMRY